MKKRAFVLLVLVCAGSAGLRSIASAPASEATNPYYVSTEGEAELANGEKIKGKFYYHEPPIGDEDSFYFYPSDIKSLRIIPITDVKKARFLNKKKESIAFTLVGKKLQRDLPDGKTQQLTTRVLRHVADESPFEK
jgi:hypothetical protein